MAGISTEMRLAHGGSIQQALAGLGDVFLKDTTEADLGKRKKKDIIALQSWVKTSFSPLVLCFFLADRDDNLAEGGNPNASAGRNTTAALTEAEKAVQLRATLVALLEKHILPKVKHVIDNCDDSAVLSTTLVRALSNVRRDWYAFMQSAKYLLMSLETESGRSGSQQVEAVFKRTFQDTVFQTFREKLVESLHNVVVMVRAEPSKIGGVETQNAMDLVRQFFDDVNSQQRKDGGGDDDDDGGAHGGSAASTSGSEWAHSETKKLEDFHHAFVEPYKQKMSAQLRAISDKYEMDNNLAALLSWIPEARRREVELVRAIFYSVYPADFEALCNNILYEFDVKVASHNASRLVEHNEFGVEHILQKLPLEDAQVKWDVAQADEATLPLMRRMKDLYSVSLTAQKAVATPAASRALPRTVTRNQRAVERRVQRENTGGADAAAAGAANAQAAVAAAATTAAPVAGAAASSAVPEDAPAYTYFLQRIRQHGARAIKEVIDNCRTRVFRNPNEFATELVGNCVGLLFRQKDSIFRNLCENSTDVARAYQDAFKKQVNNDREKPTYKLQAMTTAPTPGGAMPPAVTKEMTFAETCASFVDDFIRGKEQDIEAQADIAAELVSLFNDKDVFLDCHKHKTSRRLLSTAFDERVADRENTILSRLTSQVTASLLRRAGPGMIEDLQAHTATQRSFEEHQNAQLVASDQAHKVAKINARIITGSFWPMYQPIPKEETLELPPSLVHCQRMFENFYKKRAPTKVLKWQHGRGTAVVEMSFALGKKEVSMPIYQAIVVLCVDTEACKAPGRGITLTELHKKTGMPESEVEKCLAGALFARGMPLQVLRFADASPGAKPRLQADGIEINPDFQLKMKKFNLQLANINANQSKDDSDSKPDDVTRQREQLVDVAIVRIMKASKQMQYNELVARVISQLERSFLADPKMIKLRVSSLIERDFLLRDQEDASLFHYKA